MWTNIRGKVSSSYQAEISIENYVSVLYQVQQGIMEISGLKRVPKESQGCQEYIKGVHGGGFVFPWNFGM